MTRARRRKAKRETSSAQPGTTPTGVGPASERAGRRTWRRPPRIRTRNRQLRDVAAQALDALERAPGEPSLFVYGGALVRVRGDSDGHPRLADVDTTTLRHLLARAADFDGRGRGGLKLPPP
jgi:hypothetical protein